MVSHYLSLCVWASYFTLCARVGDDNSNCFIKLFGRYSKLIHLKPLFYCLPHSMSLITNNYYCLRRYLQMGYVWSD